MSTGAKINLRINRPRINARTKTHSTHPIWFIVPAFFFLIIFFIIPTILNFVYSFTDWSSFKTEVNFSGLSNFNQLFSSGNLVADLRITILYAVLVAIFQNLFGFALALLLERDTLLNRIARASFFIPVIMSALAVGYVFQAVLEPKGAVNSLISFIMGRPVEIPWLYSTTWTIVVVSVIHAWKWMGLAMLIFLAGLKTIDSEVLEAARIDGASWFQTLRTIRFPLLAPAITFNVATSLLGSMNSFDIVQATTQGGPGGTTELLNIYIVRAFGQGLFAQATAMSLVLFILVMALAFPLIWSLRRREQIL